MFRDISTETFNKSIEEFSKRYVKENFMVLIENCSNGEIQIEELIKKLQDTLNKK